ncbi:hypothetical protein [Acinetobacter proteolyticus]|uniref:Uncharacterized protein n=1 Tax=Acinetobacter proteolyticus TaxID=1776741 RepID=A0A2N0W9D9_9GAMM|nr:hypothetical protein [Acinetobacter proteolyticus]MBK5646494.1 hypothetical protein [Acinetobacter sp.]PKF31080.1 hypothetical protein CW311_20715 [Acinetobacter proteolyticus]
MSSELKNLANSLQSELDEIKQQTDLENQLNEIRQKIYALDDENLEKQLNSLKSEAIKLFEENNFNFKKEQLNEGKEKFVFSYGEFVISIIFPNPKQPYLGYRSVIDINVSHGRKQKEYFIGLFSKSSSLQTEKLPLPERIQALEKYLEEYEPRKYHITTVNAENKRQDLLVTELENFSQHIDVLLKHFKAQS